MKWEIRKCPIRSPRKGYSPFPGAFLFFFLKNEIIKVLKGALSEEEKKEMISRVTEIVAEKEARPILKEKMQPHTWCIIEEVDFGKWGIWGNPVTPEMLKEY